VGAGLSIALVAAVAIWAGQGMFALDEHDQEPAEPQAPAPRLISAGIRNTCATTAAGALACWGHNTYGQLGDGSEDQRSVPDLVRGLPPVSTVAVGYTHVCAATASGQAFCWGDNGFGSLGDGTTENRSVPVPVQDLSSGVGALAAGAEWSCALTTSGAVQCWGFPERLANILEATAPIPVGGLGSGVVAISGSDFHTCVLRSNADVGCWGRNFNGQLGIGNVDRVFGVRDVEELDEDVAAVTAGVEHTCALTTSGATMCWGLNSDGQLGDGTMQDRKKPTPVIGLPGDVVEIDAGATHTCALIDDGSVWCWGRQAYGQLGDATAARSSTPVQVGGLPGIVDIEVGANHACAFADDFTLWCWGDNRYGQLGDGTKESSAIPVRVTLPADPSPMP
jgi:alpha-tubulin suppressor-like RCC1 family protein